MLRTTTRAATRLLSPSASVDHGVKHRAIRWSSGRVAWRSTSQVAVLPTRPNRRCLEKQQRDLYTSTGTGLSARTGSGGALRGKSGDALRGKSGGAPRGKEHAVLIATRGTDSRGVFTTPPGPEGWGVFCQQHFVLMGSAAGWAGIVAVGMSGGVVLDGDLLARMIGNVPMVFAIVGFSDTLAQFLAGARPSWLLTGKQQSGVVPVPPPINFRQSVEVGAVGVAITSFGTVLWLDCLHVLIPAANCGITSGSAMAALALKVSLDSAMWGTVANTISMVARRMVRRQTLLEAAAFWRESFFQVTRSNFAFWPAWAAIVFTVAPPEMQVASYAVGNIFWNVYLALLCRKDGTEGTLLVNAETFPVAEATA